MKHIVLFENCCFNMHEECSAACMADKNILLLPIHIGNRDKLSSTDKLKLSTNTNSLPMEERL